MNWQAFFTSLRSNLFGTMKQSHIDGCTVVLNTAQEHGATLEQAAYILATAYGETGGRMEPIRENMNYSLSRARQVFSAKRLGPNFGALVGNPRAIANQLYNGMLGNRHGTDDGWNFRGGGLGQTTGRSNYAKGAEKFGMQPEAFAEWNMTLPGGAMYLTRGMLEGWTTGKKLSDYINENGIDYHNARRTWNGTFAADKYAGYARHFERALKAAGYVQQEPRQSGPVGAVVGAVTAVAASGGVASQVESIDPMIAMSIALGAILFLVVVIKLKGKRK